MKKYNYKPEVNIGSQRFLPGVGHVTLSDALSDELAEKFIEEGIEIFNLVTKNDNGGKNPIKRATQSNRGGRKGSDANANSGIADSNKGIDESESNAGNGKANVGGDESEVGNGKANAGGDESEARSGKAGLNPKAGKNIDRKG